jgi:hypothetical protein
MRDDAHARVTNRPEGCIRDEAEVQEELAKTWSTFRSSAQAICVQETKIGGAPSYVEVLTCLRSTSKRASPRSRIKSRWRCLRRHRNFRKPLRGRKNSSGGSPLNRLFAPSWPRARRA